MFDFFQRPELWWSLTGLFVVLFAVASFPHPSVEALPWLLFAAGSATIALLPNGTMGRAAQLLMALGWTNPTMRWHLIVAAIFSLGISFITMGGTGFVPVMFTGLVTHPLSFLRFASEFNRAPLGDNGWPFLILSAVAAPWAFPVAYGLIAHTGMSAMAPAVRAAIYAGIVALWWVAQSVGFSFLLFRRNLF
jgi:hypothetical protein